MQDGQVLVSKDVAVRGYKAQPMRVAFKTWLALTDKAVALVEMAVTVGREWGRT